MVPIWLPDRVDKKSRRAFPRASSGKLDDVLCSGAQTKCTPYYSQANGLAESTNKTLQNILRKIVNENQTDWDTKLQSALWAYHTTYKTNIRTTPFRLAFRLEAVMLVEFQIPSLRIQVKERLSEKESEKIRLATLCELEETRIASLFQLELEQRRRKAFVDRHMKRSSKSENRS